MCHIWHLFAASAIIGLVILFSGCSQSARETTDLNNTTLTGHVYYNGMPAEGASIEAIATDGIHGSNAVADNNGAYMLYLAPLALRYTITATYQGLDQTIGPFRVAQGSNSPRDIRIAASNKPVIRGWASLDGREKDIQITATPDGGGRSLTAYADASGNFTLYVEPGVTYTLGGSFHSSWGMPTGMSFSYHNDGPVQNITLDRGQSVDVYYSMYIVHPPKMVSPPPVSN